MIRWPWRNLALTRIIQNVVKWVISVCLLSWICEWNVGLCVMYPETWALVLCILKCGPLCNVFRNVGICVVPAVNITLEGWCLITVHPPNNFYLHFVWMILSKIVYYSNHLWKQHTIHNFYKIINLYIDIYVIEKLLSKCKALAMWSV